MNRYRILFACCLALSACVKNSPELFDGPAPILLGTEVASVKGSAVESAADLEGLSFRVYSMDQDGKPMLSAAPAVSRGSALCLQARTSAVDSTYLYPRDNDKKYKFYALHSDIDAADSVSIGHRDILWGESSAATLLYNPSDASDVYEGYNYNYAVRASLWYPGDAAYRPKITLSHRLARISFAFVLEDGVQAPAGLTLSKVTLGGVCRRAKFNVLDGSLTASDKTDTLIVSRGTQLGVYPAEGRGNILGTVFVLPGAGGIKFNYTLHHINGTHVTNWAKSKATDMPSNIVFQAGHHYIFKIKIKKKIDDIEAYLYDNYIDADADTFDGLDFDWGGMGDDDDDDDIIGGTIDYE